MSESKLTNAQKARIERNRQKALLLRNSRLTNRPYPLRNKEKDGNTYNEINSGTSSGSTTSSRIVDTGGGFLLDAEDEEEWSKPPINLVEEPAPVLGGERLICDECGKEFMDSHLYRIFGAYICDSCRQSDESGHFSLITKTEAKQEFLLKDVDLDKREPPLKYQVKKNPHHSRGEMKLYLLSQVKERANQVWGDEDKLEQAKEDKIEKREIQKQKKFDKKVKELRKAVRTSTWRKDLSKHEHTFPKEGEEGGETYDEETDTWTKTCKECGYQVNFEKM